MKKLNQPYIIFLYVFSIVWQQHFFNVISQFPTANSCISKYPKCQKRKRVFFKCLLAVLNQKVKMMCCHLIVLDLEVEEHQLYQLHLCEKTPHLKTSKSQLVKAGFLNANTYCMHYCSEPRIRTEKLPRSFTVPKMIHGKTYPMTKRTGLHFCIKQQNLRY